MTHDPNSSSDFLLVTSCHCSISLSSNKHGACNSSSSSCTSSLMSPSSSSSVKTLVPTPLGAIGRNVYCFPTAPANSDVTFATFLLSFFLLSCLRSWTTVPSQHDALLFSPFPLLRYFCSTLQLGAFPPLHPPLAHVPLYTACTASSDVFPYPSVPAAMPISIGALVSKVFTFDAEFVVTLSLTMFSNMAMWCHGIDSSANSQASFFLLPRSCLRLKLSQTLLRTFSSHCLRTSSNCATSSAR